MSSFERPDSLKELLRSYILITALLLEGGVLAPTEFEGLRTELKLGGADLVTRFREVGASCHATTYKREAEDGSSVSERSQNVSLLRGVAGTGTGASAGKTLGEMFPVIKMVKKQGGRG